MKKQLVIGNRTFPSYLIQAPLAGVSCAPFRELVWDFGGVAYCCTEMLSAQHLAKNIDRSPRYQAVSASEGPLCWQLSGNDPDYLAHASERAIGLGADVLDLNCGCPQPKIRKKNCGSRLLEDEKKLMSLVIAMQRDVRVPVTLKMRVDAGHGDFCEVTLAKMLEQAGIAAVIVHGRHWTHTYETDCQNEAIARVVDAVSIPVIANGDVADLASLQKIIDDTQCAGVMIGRAAVGQPWLFRQLLDPDFTLPTISEIGALFIRHVQGLITLEGERNAILQSRKFAKYYARTLAGREQFVETICQVMQFDQFCEVVAKYFNVS